jgi:lysine-N-methylase
MAAHQFTPRFYELFQCIGDQCEDNCCHDWAITIDKKTYQRYVTHPDQLIQSTAKTRIKRTRKAENNWAVITLDETGKCPFLTEGLCQIHTRAGPQALSHTCQNYPRVISRFANNQRLSLTLSCPEACRQVLLNPDALLIGVSPLAGYHPLEPLSPATLQLHQYSLDILLTEGLSVEEKLWLIGLLIHRDSSALSNEAFLGQISQLIEDRQLTAVFSQLPFISQVQWKALRNLTYLQVLNAQTGSQRGQPTMQRCLEQIQQLLAGEFNTDRLGKLHETWHREVAPFLAARPHILQNYLVYYVYHHHFPHQPPKSPQQCYRLLIADYFLLRSYLCLLAMEGKLTEQDVVNLFYSYHSLRQHNRDFEDAIDKVLTEHGENMDLTLYALLQTAVAP